MNFDELNKFVPYHLIGKEKSIRYEPYPNIVLAMPGRHAYDTSPLGGDFVVMVTDPVFARAEHQFTHTDIFKDVEQRSNTPGSLIGPYFQIIQGDDPDGIGMLDVFVSGVDRDTFLHAVQCLAVAEHRRYRQFEKQFGGRYLPFRFAAGIDEGLWTAADAASMQKKGRPGVEILEKMNGVPTLTQELMK